MCQQVVRLKKETAEDRRDRQVLAVGQVDCVGGGHRDDVGGVARAVIRKSSATDAKYYKKARMQDKLQSPHGVRFQVQCASGIWAGTRTIRKCCPPVDHLIFDKPRTPARGESRGAVEKLITVAVPPSDSLHRIFMPSSCDTTDTTATSIHHIKTTCGVVGGHWLSDAATAEELGPHQYDEIPR